MPDRDASSHERLTLPRELSALVAALASRYVIEREVGRGGMATVYLARDVKHQRQVALKILNPELGAVLGVERFLSEIRVTANLQHPNLLPLFDSGDAEGLLYYVMPYVAGESLRAKLAREKQLPIEEAIHIAAAVASALDYAHRHGVIHRDLKPENILLHEGQPLIADFGIALAVSKAGGDRITQTGLSLGTPQYMSPEQATGDRIVDGRTDIYSLGAVTYEMLTGEPPHTGTTAQAIIARVLTDQVRSLRSSRASVPEHVEDAVLRALEKLPADRWHTAHEFAAALTGEPATHGTGIPSLAFTRRGRRRSSRARAVLAVVPWAVAALALGAAGAGWLRTIPEARLSRFHMMLPDSAPVTVQLWVPSIAFSPNGSRLVYKGPKDALFVKALDDFAARLIPGTEGSYCPSFSPDGAWILYGAQDGKLKKVLTGGGSPIVVADTAACGTWTERNEIVFARVDGLYRVPAEGGSAQLVASSRDTTVLTVSALPGGDAVLVGLYTGAVSGSTNIAVLSLADGRLASLGFQGNAPQYSRTGHILYARQGDIFAAPFSLRTRRPTGPAVPVARDATVSKFAVASFSVVDGTLAYIAGDPVSGRLYAVDLAGNERALSSGIPFAGWPRVSPDGERVSLEISTGRNAFEIWVYELRSRTLARVTSTDFSLRPTGWSADSRGIYYIAPDSTNFAAQRSVSWVSWDRSESRRELLRLDKKEKALEVASVGPAHGYMALSVNEREQWDIWIAPIDTPKAARPFVATSATEWQPQFSADGKLLAYTTDETSRTEVYVQPVPGPGGRVQVSAGGGTEPVWDRAGRLYYRGPRRMMRATLATAPQLRLVRRDTLFEDIYDREPYAPFYDVIPGGKELLMLRSETRPRLAVVLNWPELLRRSGTTR